MLTRAEPWPRTLCSASRQTTPLTLLSLRSSTSARASRHQPMRCNAQANPPEQQQEDVEYKDSWSDIQFINMCRTAYGNLSGWQSPRDWKNGPETYQGMIEVSRALMKVCVRCSNCCKMEYTLPVGAKGLHSWQPAFCTVQGKSATEQRDAVIKGFPGVPAWFRIVFPYSKWGAELNARITPAFFTWLVGPMQTQIAEVGGIQQRSSVHIIRCRYNDIMPVSAPCRTTHVQIPCNHTHEVHSIILIQFNKTLAAILAQLELWSIPKGAWSKAAAAQTVFILHGISDHAHHTSRVCVP